jgi:hypothetical protein
MVIIDADFEVDGPPEVFDARGGHFAALEAPDLLIRDIREFFGSLR